MEKDWRVRVDDIREAIGKITDYTSGMGQVDFIGDDRTLDAVVLNLEIIGEASARMPAHVMQAYPLIPWGKWAEIRNLLIHEYHSVAPEVIWRTVTGDIPPLKTMINAIDLEAPLPDEED